MSRHGRFFHRDQTAASGSPSLFYVSDTPGIPITGKSNRSARSAHCAVPLPVGCFPPNTPPSLRSPAVRCGALLTRRMHAVKSLGAGFSVCLLVLLGPASNVSASSWTCQKAGLTREVLVFYPEAPERLPCKVFYSKPNENVLPHALWEAKNRENYCERKAAGFVEKLSASGWRCVSDDQKK